MEQASLERARALARRVPAAGEADPDRLYDEFTGWVGEGGTVRVCLT